MSIEFRCTKCSKLLRTADETAGKHAKCPECGEVLSIPAASITSSPFASSAGGFSPPPPSGPAGGSPFAGESQPQYGYQPDTGNPYQSPNPFSPLPPTPAEPGELRPTIIDFNDIISRTWTMLKENYVVVLLGWFVPAIIGNIVNYGLSFGGVIIGNVVFRSQEIAQILNFAGSFFGIFFSCWLFLGQSIYMLKVARGQDAQLSDVFSGGRFYLTGLMAMILWFLAYIGGILLLIVPGVIWGLMFSQCYFFVIDRNADATASLSLSKQFMQGNKATVFLIWLVCGMGGGVIVLCTCFIGAFAVYPFLSLLNAVIYLGVTGQPTAYQYRSAPPM